MCTVPFCLAVGTILSTGASPNLRLNNCYYYIIEGIPQTIRIVHKFLHRFIPMWETLGKTQ